MISPDRSGPLAGLRVVEFAQIMAGPTAGGWLADMGADVIKVEPVAGGDATRDFRPPDLDGESAAFMMLNRNKRGVALDLKSEGGLEVARRLVERADVLIENHRTGTMDRLGLGYDLLRESNPGLICSVRSRGSDGPGERPGEGPRKGRRPASSSATESEPEPSAHGQLDQTHRTAHGS